MSEKKIGAEPVYDARKLGTPRMLDCTEVQRVLNWSPTYTSQEAFDSYVAAWAATSRVLSVRRRRPARST